jgi:adhesin/invasin
MGCDQGVYVDTEPVSTLVEARKIEVSKTVSPPLVRAGDRLASTIVFTNASDVAAQNVYITDTLPAGFTGVTSDTTDALFNRRDGNAYGWFVATMPAGDTGAIAVSANAITTSIESGGTVFWNTVETTSTQATTPVSDVVPVTVIPGWAAATTVAIVPATTLVGIPADVSVAVVDRYGNPVYDGDGYFVSLAGEPAGLTFDPASIPLVNGQGTATVDSPAVGTYTVTAMVVGRPDLSDTALVTFTPDVLDHFVVGPIADQTAGLNFTIAITAVDQNNNPVADFNGVVRIEDGATPETLQPDTTAPFVNGVLAGQVVSITLARTNSPIVVRAGSRVTTSNPFTVRAGPPAEITVSTSRITVPVGYDEPVTATVVDAYGNLVPGQELTFGVSGGTADPVVSTTNADGVATSYLSSMLPGEATVLVTARNGVTGSTLVIFLACPDRIMVTVDPTSVQVGQSAVITVQAEDANGNAVSWGHRSGQDLARQRRGNGQDRFDVGWGQDRSGHHG